MVNTSVKQAYVIVAKDQYVAGVDVFYADPALDLEAFDAFVDMAGADATRINSLSAVLTVLEDMPSVEDYNSFFEVFVPSVVASNIDNSRRWVLSYKQLLAQEKALAAKEGREENPVVFKNKIKTRTGEFVHTITSYEVEMWQELHRQLGEKFYISIRSVIGAKNYYKPNDARHKPLAEAISACWDAIRDMGADIAEQTQEETTAVETKRVDFKSRREQQRAE